MQTVSLDTFASLQLKLTAKDEVITMLENRVLVLEEEIEELKEATDKTKVTKKDGKTYSTDTRMSEINMGMYCQFIHFLFNNFII